MQAEAALGTLLYASRQLSGGWKRSYRRLMNEALIVEIVRADVSDVLYLETLSFEQRVALFSRAKVIVGPPGSGMLNVLFVA